MKNYFDEFKDLSNMFLRNKEKLERITSSSKMTMELLMDDPIKNRVMLSNISEKTLDIFIRYVQVSRPILKKLDNCYELIKTEYRDVIDEEVKAVVEELLDLFHKQVDAVEEGASNINDLAFLLEFGTDLRVDSIVEKINHG